MGEQVLVKVSHRGTLFGAECLVLEDGRRGFSLRGANAAISTGARGSDFARLFARLANENEALPPAPDEKIQDGPRRAVFVSAEVFCGVLETLSARRDEGVLRKDQEHLGKKANTILRALARVGLVALIDEATGYQATREVAALRHLADYWIRDEPDAWTMRFTPSLVQALAPLYGIQWRSGPHPLALRTPNRMIYEFIFGPELTAALAAAKTDKVRLHQMLMEQGQRILETELPKVELLASQAGSKAEFWARMRTRYRGESLQLPLLVQGA